MYRKKGETLLFLIAMAFFFLIILLLLIDVPLAYGAPATSTSCGDVRTSLTLTANVFANAVTHNSPGTCFIINGSNLFLDGGNFQIIGNTSGIGINISLLGNITIRNFGNISNFTYGIFGTNISNSTITNNSIRNNTFDGIYLESSQHNSILNNTFFLNVRHGIILNLSINNTITRNKMNATGDAEIRLENSSSNRISYNNISFHISSPAASISFYGSFSNRVENNTFINPNVGFDLDEASDFNFIYNNNFSNPTNEEALILTGADNNNITSNSFTPDCGDGGCILFQTRADENNFSTNIITAGLEAPLIDIANSISNKFFGNTVTINGGIGVGIGLRSGANYSDISANTFYLISATGETSALQIDSSSFANISSNIINVSKDTSFGIRMLGVASNNVLISNNITFTNLMENIVGMAVTSHNIVESNSLTLGGISELVIGIRIDGTNITLINNNITVNYSTGYEIFDTNSGTPLNFLIYNNSFGEIKWIDNGTGSFPRNITVISNNSAGIGYNRNIFIDNNTIAFNTSAFGVTPRINSSANLTLRGLTFRAFDQMRTVGNYTTTAAEIRAAGINCDGTSCENLSYDATNGILIFNTTGFSSFSAHDATTPQIVNFWMNATNNSNFSSSLVSKLIFNATVNDTATITEVVRFGFSNGNGTAFNFTGTLNSTLYSTELNTSAVTDGFYTVQIYANDSFNNLNNTVSNLSFTLDRTPPNVSAFYLSNLSNGSNVSGGVIFFNVSINDSTTFAKFASIGLTNDFRNGTEFNVTLARNFSGFHTALILSTMTDGFYTVRVYANDTLDNVNMSVANLSFTLDRTPPNVTQFLLNDSFGVLNASNFTNGGVVAFNITINDSTLSVETVKVGLTNDFRNGTEFNITLLRNFSGYHAAVDFNTLTDGFYILKVYANDTLGNTNNTLANLSFRVDRTPPNVSGFYLSNLTNASNVSGGVIFFNVSINDSTTFARVASIGLTNDFRNGTEFNVTLARNFSGFHVALILSTMTDGFYTVRVYANDTLDNVNMSVANLSFTLDRTPPNVTTFGMGNLTNGTTGANLTGGTISFNVSVNDSTLSTETVLFSIFNDFRNSTSFNISAVKNFSGYQATLILSTMTDGVYTVTVLANDTVGNQNNSVSNVSFTIDRTPPNVTQFLLNTSDLVAMNASNFTNSGVLSFNITVNDSTLTVETVKVGLTNDFRNGTEFNITLLRNFSGYHAAVAFNTLTDGFYTLKVYANDTLGNTNNTLANLSFRVDTTPPNVTAFGMNVSNAATVDRGPIQFNATINDSTTTVTSVRFGFSNNQNASQFNVTAVRNESGGIYHILLQLNTLSCGEYTATTYANDTLGNVNNSVANLTFTIPCAEANPGEGSPSSSSSSSSPAAPASPAPSPAAPAETPAPVSTPAQPTSISITPSAQSSGDSAAGAGAPAERRSSLRIDTIKISITNNENIELVVSPVITEALPSLPLEEKYRDLLRSELSGKYFTKAQQDQKLELEIETLRHLEKQKANYLFGKAFSFGLILPKQDYSISGITYSKDRILGKLLRSELLDVEEIAIPPGQTINKEIAVRRGLSITPTPVTLTFSSQEKTLSTTDIPAASSVVGGAIDVNNQDNIFEVYFLIPPALKTDKNLEVYTFEFAIDEARPASKLHRFDYKYSESFGPYAVKTDEGFLFIQQFTYDETRYQGEHIFTMRLFQEGNMVAQQEYTLAMG